MKILFPSNYLSNSAYAIQARMIVPRLIEAGHVVRVLNIGGAGVTTQVDGVTVLPMAIDPLGNDVIQDYVSHEKIQAVITLCDVWAFKSDIWSTFPWYPITPVDHTPAPPAVVNALRAAVKPIAMSKFAQKQLAAFNIDSFYMPLAYDPTIWYPGDKQTARDELGIPDDMYYVTFVGVNDSVPSRKGIPELLAAWSAYSVKNPNARLRLHTSLTGKLAAGSQHGVNIPALLKLFGIDQTTVSIVDQYRYNTGFPASELATLARASDLLILPTRGEGFGLPLVEFQASGCPVAVTNTTTAAELNFSGWMIEGEPDWSWQHAMQMKPGITSIFEALDAGSQDRDNPIRRQAAIDGAKEYAIDNVVKRYLLPTIHSIAESVLECSSSAIVNKYGHPQRKTA